MRILVGIAQWILFSAGGFFFALAISGVVKGYWAPAGVFAFFAACYWVGFVALVLLKYRHMEE